MTTTSLPSTAGSVVGSPHKRPSPDVVGADIFNRLYVAAMFAVIIAIGGFGFFALARSQQSSDIVTHSFENANDATIMRSALDREQSELHWQMQRGHGEMSERLAEAAQAFETAHAEVQTDGWADKELLKTLGPVHAAYAADSRAIFAALARGDQAKAARIEVNSARPNVSMLRHDLDVLSTDLFAASMAADVLNRRFQRGLQLLIAVATGVGIILMAGFAMLLGRYKRSAETAAAAVLSALEQAALTDSLTGLGNNRSFHDDFEREIARAKRHHLSLAVALIDVDDFKAVNDKAGHKHGDAVLARVGELLNTMRAEDRGYRIGGDEFALLLVDTDPRAAALALERLQQEIRESGLGATVSIGYVNLDAALLEVESYELADTALYEAKRMGRNQTVSYDDIRGLVSVFSPRKANAVRTMVAQGQLATAFQPIWDMQSTRPLGFEALARPLPETGLSGPQEAFDVAQRIRQLPELDRLCTRKTLEAAVNLPAGSVIFMNYSPASLTHAGFDPKAFVAAVRAAGLQPEQIVIELTERRIDDPSIVAKRVAALKLLGIRMALDDTGSGHAGLEILSKVRFDFVKIDRELIVGAMENGEARGVLAGIIAIARETGSYLIAEGIETGEMLDFIRNAHIPHFAGVRGIQGYLLGRPELGSVNLGSLERHHDFLAKRRADESKTPGTIGTIGGEESGAAAWQPSRNPLAFT